MTFLGLPSRSDDIASMEAFVADNNVEAFDHLIDLNGEIWTALGIFDQPAFAFVNDNGEVEVNVGSFEPEELLARAQALIDS